MIHIPTPHRVPLVIAALAVLLACCGAPPADTPAAPAPAGTGFPRTLDVDGTEVIIEAEPQRVVALSTDVADVALQLVGPDRVVGVPQYIQSEFTSAQHELAGEVENALASSVGGDPEAILALDPDLVLLTTRHDSEQDALALLQQAGVPTVGITNSWEDFDTYRQNVTLLGEALGAQDRANEMIDEYDRRIEAVTRALGGLPEQDKPVVGQVRLLSDSFFLAAPGTIGYTVLAESGAINAADVLGMTESGRASVELVIDAAPSHLVLLDSSGEGRAPYADLLDHPGMRAVPAVAQDNILVLPARAVASGGGGVDALEKISWWLHPELVDKPGGA